MLRSTAWWTQTRQYLELIRFSHTLFALPFALTSALLAWQAEPVRLWDVVGILWCMLTARSTAMAFNRIADRHYDAANPRTASRHLPTGRLSLTGVTVFTLLSAGLFVLGTLFFLMRTPANWLPLALAVPVLLFLWSYSYTKRFTWLCHFWLGASLMLAPIATWIAICGAVSWTPILLGLAVWAWVAGFDIIYACQDIDFDRQAGLYSIPARYGITRALWMARLCHATMLAALALLWWQASLGWVFGAGLLVIAALLVYEHVLVKPHDLSLVNRAFFQVNALVSIGLFGSVLLDLWVT